MKFTENFHNAYSDLPDSPKKLNPEIPAWMKEINELYERVKSDYLAKMSSDSLTKKAKLKYQYWDDQFVHLWEDFKAIDNYTPNEEDLAAIKKAGYEALMEISPRDNIM